MKWTFLPLLLALGMLSMMPLAKSFAAGSPVNYILDTDLASDCDDAGAIAMANAMMKAGEVNILAMMISTGGDTCAPALCAINTWYGHGDIPIGTLKQPDFWTGGEFGQTSGVQNYVSYTPYLAREFPAHLHSGQEAPDATALYREILAEQPNGSVVINTIGPLINLAKLLASPGGPALVKAKVKLLVVAGGKNPAGTSSNFSKGDAKKYAKGVIEQWPTPIVFVGNEVGGSVLTGWPAAEPSKQENPARAAYRLFHAGDSGKKRPSWDHAAVLYAIRGEGALFDLVKNGYQSCSEDGNNLWVTGQGLEKGHAYLRKVADDAVLQAVFEDLMTRE